MEFVNNRFLAKVSLHSLTFLQDAELARRKAKEDEMSDEERQKLKDAALKLKAEGNEFYLKDRNDDANRKYSEALEMCPLCFKKERAVFFANRAAAKCKMVSGKQGQ